MFSNNLYEDTVYKNKTGRETKERINQSFYYSVQWLLITLGTSIVFIFQLELHWLFSCHSSYISRCIHILKFHNWFLLSYCIGLRYFNYVEIRIFRFSVYKYHICLTFDHPIKRLNVKRVVLICRMLWNTSIYNYWNRHV